MKTLRLLASAAIALNPVIATGQVRVDLPETPAAVTPDYHGYLELAGIPGSVTVPVGAKKATQL